jgi:uroporphyrinogen III methyltransferase/synthase
MDGTMPHAGGFVSIVGAGPGDPGLITQRGAERLRTADVVLYDFLLNPVLLNHAPPAARRVLVGKRAGQHVLPQSEINTLLVKLAREGKRVVRLKGGDPLLFGRGAEEMQALRAAGIRFEVVPGVTAGLAGMSYAGIPATARGSASTITFITGHEAAGKDAPSVDYDALAALGGTLVFYMGVRRVREIAQRLTGAGLPGDTPCCMLEWATLPGQRTVVGSLTDIADRAAQAGVEPPALIVVGEVVTRRDALDWFVPRGPAGRTVVLLMSGELSEVVRDRLEACGAGVCVWPAAQAGAADDARGVFVRTILHTHVDALVFRDVEAGQQAIGLFDEPELAALSERCTIAAMGPEIARLLRAAGGRNIRQVEPDDVEGLLRELQGQWERAE